MKSDDVKVNKSKIHGNGVFAMRDFKKGEIVLHWDTSHQISKNKYITLSKAHKQYIELCNNKYFQMQPPEKFVNHSCEANTIIDNFCDIAMRNIKKGEEITSDYAQTATSPTNLVCHCGSRKCRKIIK